MMQQFLQIIQALKDDPFYAVLIESLDTGEVLTPPASAIPPAKPEYTNSWTGKVILQKYPDIESYFNEIASKHKVIRMTFRRKNGTTFKTISEKVFDLTGNPEKDVQSTQEKAVAEKSSVMPMLGAPQGLSFADAHKIHHYEDLKKELAETKAELLIEKSKKSKLKKKMLRFETLDHKSDRTAQSQAKLLEVMGPMAMPFLEKLAGAFSSGAHGMAQPQVQNAGNAVLTTNQQIMVLSTNGVDDDLTYYLALLCQNIKNVELQKDLLETVKKHQLEPEE